MPSGIEPFDVLFEQHPGERGELTGELQHLYGGLHIGPAALYSNFVASIDGAVTLGSLISAGSIISGRDPHDRFLMGLLRAFGDAVLIGAGTLRATPGHLWTAEHVFPDLAGTFASLRSRLGLALQPRLVVVTASGHVDSTHPAIVAGATVITTSAKADGLRKSLPESCDVAVAGDGDGVDFARAVGLLRERRLSRILTEGGPHLMGELVRANLLDEIFLTLSPVLAGRDRETRLGMIAGLELLPDRGAWASLASVRRSGNYLFLRYDLRSKARP